MSTRVSLTLEELELESIRYDEAVLRTPDVDHFCSSSLWVLPSAHHLQPPSTPWILRTDDAYLALARTRHGDGTTVLHPLEAMWALPCPVVGPDPSELVELFTDSLRGNPGWDVALLTGLSETSKLWKMLVPALSRWFTLSRGPITRRYIADLSRGVDGFLANRSAGFRKNLRKAERRARGMDIRFEIADECDPRKPNAAFDRLLAIEKRSWKGLRGIGMDAEPMSSFYRDMNRRLVDRRARRLLFVTLEGEDVAYIFGGVFGNTYRGLQFSFDHRFSELSLGNLCQLQEIRRLCHQGVALYDLGTEVRYKKRWGDRVFSTSSLFVQS